MLSKKAIKEINKQLGPAHRRWSPGVDGAIQGQLSELEHAADVPKVLRLYAAAGGPIEKLELWLIELPEPQVAAALTTALAGAKLRSLSIVARGASLPTPPLPAGLSELRLAGVRLGPKGAKSVVDCSPGLVSLTLAEAHVGDAGAQALARLSHLRELSLGHCDLGDPGLSAILSAPLAAQLIRFELRAAPQVGKQLAGLAACGALEKLSLYALALDSGAARAIAKLGSRLTELGLREVGLTDALAALLAKAPMTRLQKLDVNGNPVSAAGLDPLIRSAPALRQLEVPPSIKVRAAWVKRGRTIL